MSTVSNNPKPEKEVITGYIPTLDITVIFEQTYYKSGSPKSLEVKGFYYGKPDEKATLKFYGDLKADFEDEE